MGLPGIRTICLHGVGVGVATVVVIMSVIVVVVVGALLSMGGAGACHRQFRFAGRIDIGTCPQTVFDIAVAAPATIL